MRRRPGRAWLRAACMGAVLLAAPVASLAQQATSESAAGTAPRPAADEAGTRPAAGAAPGPAASPVFERDVVEVDPAPGIDVSRIGVDNRLGSVRIEGHDHDSVVIIASKRAPDAATLERLRVALIPDPSGPVRISTAITAGADARPIPGGLAAIDLVIRAPRAARVEARVWNGRLTVMGMENGAELHANNGDIDVRNVSGTIETHSAGGTQQFAEVFGAVDAQALAGSMDLDMVRGDRLEASVHEGRIQGRQVQVRYAWLHTVRGDIHLYGQAMAGGHYRVGSYSGNIDVQLAAAGPVRVQAHADSGTASLPPALQPRPQGEGMVTGLWSRGQGTPALVELRSRMGSIRFSLAE